MADNDALLPIGSVVTLAGAGEKTLVVVGHKVSVEGREFDYMATLCPEGWLGPDEIWRFDSGDIGEVLHVGYEDANWSRLRALLEDPSTKGKGIDRSQWWQDPTAQEQEGAVSSGRDGKMS
jgi:hypothetical protein